ncbi:mannose-6-phosphate isomerase, class I [Breznakiella homolactica]|uniref:mannose-6-phosphate isomerase n=1 Tax=Breznakiella homolactica TaxID=2798577 RepID=A0A7T7XJD5_9SPIR|nr:mannose-6-phosphate isomerase, class I [Breznakiella homolactica]QQO07375.1 mannose-6-phosphate isomerase, class I [Breznakiella homolactica]
MDGIYTLSNQVKYYDWGSPEWIPDLLGIPNTSGSPWAELWMGIHPGAPSEAMDGGALVPLPELIRRNPPALLGKSAEERYGTLPFLFKILAAARPLSIQVHPNLEQAKNGWERENNAGIPLDSPERNYQDPNHKPEILCALSPFRAMCGFRHVSEIRILAGACGTPVLDTARKALEDKNEEAALRGFVSSLFELPGNALAELGVYLRNRTETLTEILPQYRREWELCRDFSLLYREDAGILAPLYLNVLDLNPGEAIFLPAGILHAYVRGLGVELMANSDNVLRGGLTSKHVDIDELCSILSFKQFLPDILNPPAPSPDCFTYPGETAEFSLTVANNHGSDRQYPLEGPNILIVTEGTLELSRTGSAEKMILSKGESAFVSAGVSSNPVRCTGTYRMYCAGIGTDRC